MSKLYASISADASKTEATRRGHKRITTHTRGWDLGVKVEARLDGTGEPTFDVYVTSGSKGGAGDQLLGNVALMNGDRYFFPAARAAERASAEQRRWLDAAETDAAITDLERIASAAACDAATSVLESNLGTLGADERRSS